MYICEMENGQALWKLTDDSSCRAAKPATKENVFVDFAIQLNGVTNSMVNAVIDHLRNAYSAVLGVAKDKIHVWVKLKSSARRLSDEESMEFGVRVEVGGKASGRGNHRDE